MATPSQSVQSQRAYQYSPLPRRPYHQQPMQPGAQSMMQQTGLPQSYQGKHPQYQLAGKLHYQQRQQPLQHQQSSLTAPAEPGVKSVNNNNEAECVSMLPLAAAKRYEMLFWKFQSSPAEKLLIKGNIVLCMDNTYILGTSPMYGVDILMLMGRVSNSAAVVKRIPLPMYTPIKDNLQKLLQPKYHHEHLIKYLVSFHSLVGTLVEVTSASSSTSVSNLC